MVQLLEELPPELLAHIAGSLDDAAAAGRWAQACRASRLLLVLRLDQLLEARRSAPPLGSRLCSTSSAAHGVAPLPRSASTTWVTAMLQSVCWLAIWTSALACAALATVSFQLALPLPTRSGTSLRGCIGRATDSRFMAWALMRSRGAHLRCECPNLPTCSHEKQPCRGHSLIGMAV